MTEQPIPATVVPVESLVRPRLYMALYPRGQWADWYGTSLAWPMPDKAKECTNKTLTLFALPGSDEVWTEERVRDEARLLMADWRAMGLDDGLNAAMRCDLVTRCITFARVLGVLPEVAG